MKKMSMIIVLMIVLCVFSCSESTIGTVNSPDENEKVLLAEPTRPGYVNISTARSMLEVGDTIQINLISYLKPEKLSLQHGTLNKIGLSRRLKRRKSGEFMYNGGVYDVWLNQLISDEIKQELTDASNPVVLLVHNVSAYLVYCADNDGGFWGLYMRAESERDIKYYSLSNY